MAKRSIIFSNLVGPGVVPGSAPSRSYVDIAPAYAFVDGTAINWPVPVRQYLTGGTLTVAGVEDTYLDQPVAWAFKVVFEDERGIVTGSYAQVKTFPVGTGAIAYSALIEVDLVSLPGFGPTWAEQAKASAAEAKASATAAAADAANVSTALSTKMSIADNDAAVAGYINTADTSVTKTALKNSYSTFDVTGDKALLADATAAFVAAANTAKSAGRAVLSVAPGTYSVPGMSPGDIFDLYIVGDGVNLNGGGIAYVYPFSTDEWRGLSTRSQQVNGGRGVVGITIDDGEPSHWAEVFPLAKKLGITLATAWHTANGAQWIKEAHRHGWEVAFHMPANADTTLMTEAEVNAAAVAGVTAISAITGTKDNIGFVYPAHVRNTTTDRILSKYFPYGRGFAGREIYSTDGGRPWLVTAYFLDPELVDGVLSQGAKDFLTQIANTNGRAGLYFHFDNTNRLTHPAGITELVAYIRALGIQIQNPSQVWGSRLATLDPFDESEAQWTIDGAITRSTDIAYHSTKSFKLTTPADAVGTGNIISTAIKVTPKQGMFAIYRASWRHNNSSAVTVSAGWGFTPQIASAVQTIDGLGAFRVLTTAAPAFPDYPGTSIPVAAWARVGRLLYLDPATKGFQFRLGLANIVAGSVPIYIDDIRLDHVGYTSTVTYKVILTGTTAVRIYTGVPYLDRQAIQITPRGVVLGKISYTLSNNLIMVQSSDTTDTAEITVTIFPEAPYDSLTLPADGA